MTSHYSTAAHTFCTLFRSQINFKMHINEHIIATLYGEFKYECIRRWVSNVLATNTWKVGHSKHSYQCTHDGQLGAGKGLVRKLEEGIDLVHNKYNTTFLGVMASLLWDIKIKPPSSDVLYVEITWFVVGADHIRPAGSGDLPPSRNSVISSHSSPDYGGFIIVSLRFLGDTA